jgi:hypothetical protein
MYGYVSGGSAAVGKRCSVLELHVGLVYGGEGGSLGLPARSGEVLAGGRGRGRGGGGGRENGDDR